MAAIVKRCRRVALLAWATVPLAALVAAVGLWLQGAIGKGLLTGALLGFVVSFTTGLLSHGCYTHCSPTTALGGVFVASFIRLLSVLIVCLLLRSAERTFFLSSLVSMTVLLVLALLIDALFLALPPAPGPEEETARG